MNAKMKEKEDPKRKNYNHPYVLASAWDKTILVTLVNHLKNNWNFDVELDELDLYDELREYLFVQTE